jgi:hypothetical protein
MMKIKESTHKDNNTNRGTEQLVLFAIGQVVAHDDDGIGSAVSRQFVGPLLDYFNIRHSREECMKLLKKDDHLRPEVKIITSFHEYLTEEGQRISNGHSSV